MSNLLCGIDHPTNFVLCAIVETPARPLLPFCEERGGMRVFGSSCLRQDGINGGPVISESGTCSRGSVRCELLEGEAHVNYAQPVVATL